MSTLERVATPLLFAEQLRTVRGKTRLQKLVCLLDVRWTKEGKRLGYRFQFYHHGPFSFDLMNAVEDLVDEGLMLERPRSLPNGYVEYSYTLSPSGRKLIHRLLSSDRHLKELRADIAELSKSHGMLPLKDLVEEAYAARSELGESPVSE